MPPYEKTIDLAVIGAGPAGLSAALEAARLGIDTLLVDMYQQPGGQYFRLPAAKYRVDTLNKEMREGASLAEQVKQAGVLLWNGVEVWGVYPEDPFTVCLTGAPVKRLRAKAVIVCPGAYERPLAFPGWTLPGVMTGGGILGMLKNQGLLAGKKILLSGTGPMQLPVAAHLIASGAEVVAVLELKSLPSLLSQGMNAVRLPALWKRFGEGSGYLAALRQAKTPYRLGWCVVKAEGDTCVERAVIARVDADGRLQRGSEITIEVDTIGLGFGLIPSTHFARQLECNVHFHPDLRIHVPDRNKWRETSHPGFFVAGDSALVNGKEAALLEGRLAALGAALHLGALGSSRAEQMAGPLLKKLSAEEKFGEFLNRVFSFPAGLIDLLEDDTILCRCENIQLKQVKQAIRDGAVSLTGVKNHTRAGMGFCQGRMCSQTIAAVIAARRGISLEEASRCNIRPPVFPVPLEELLDAEGIEEG